MLLSLIGLEKPHLEGGGINILNESPESGGLMGGPVIEEKSRQGDESSPLSQKGDEHL